MEISKNNSIEDLHLIDRADGVRGHYCIGRHMEKYRHFPTPTWEFWDGDKWSSAGKVYIYEEGIIPLRILADAIRGRHGL